MRLDWVDPGTPAAVAGSLEGRFQERFHAPPDGCFAAPGRVNLIGEHVDYNQGRCLPLALPHATYAALRVRADSTVRLASLQAEQVWEGELGQLGPGVLEGWVGYAGGVLWALRQQGVDVPGVDLLVDSRLPLGAGLSSSAALECSVAVGLCDLMGLGLDEPERGRLVRTCMRAEAEVAGAPTGGLDQTASLFAQQGHALLLDCRDWSREQVTWDPEPVGLRLLVVDTRASHALADGGYAARRADCAAATRALGVSSLRELAGADHTATLARLDDARLRRRARHVLTEMSRVTEAVGHIRAHDFPGLAAALDASHVSLRDDFEVSCPELDVAVAAARDQGALGARMTGGGFGGSALALVPTDRVRRVAEGVHTAFAARGWRAPGFLLAPPSGGARRVGSPAAPPPT